MRLAHTGQHFDANLWTQVAGDVGLPAPHHHIRVGGMARGEQIGEATAALTRLLLQEPADAVVVQGDTNSTLAGALAANATGTPVVHVEAGLRSGDRSMPEESNRLLVDCIADLCCAPTTANAEVLRGEGVATDRIVVTGNTLAQSIGRLVGDAAERAAILGRHGLSAGSYVLATIHRASNVADPQTLGALLRALDDLGRTVPVLLPIHPHTLARTQRAGLLERLGYLRVLPPLAPEEFLALEHDAGLLVSDSGGVQEEAALFGVPLVIMRDSTERPELLGTWARLLGGADPRSELHRAWEDVPTWRAGIAAAGPPYPNVDAAELIVSALDALLLRRG